MPTQYRRNTDAIPTPLFANECRDMWRAGMPPLIKANQRGAPCAVLFNDCGSERNKLVW